MRLFYSSLCFMLAGCVFGKPVNLPLKGHIFVNNGLICIKGQQGNKIDRYTVFYGRTGEDTFSGIVQKKTAAFCLAKDLVSREGDYILHYSFVNDNFDNKKYYGVGFTLDTPSNEIRIHHYNSDTGVTTDEIIPWQRPSAVSE